MAFIKNSFGVSKFGEKISNTATKSKLDTGVMWGVGKNVSLEVLEIGSWDMDATSQVFLTMALKDKKIVGIDTIIYNDNEDWGQPLTASNAPADDDAQGWVAADHLNNWITLDRKVGGYFDNALLYANTTINRGYVMVWYI